METTVEEVNEDAGWDDVMFESGSEAEDEGDEGDEVPQCRLQAGGHERAQPGMHASQDRGAMGTPPDPGVRGSHHVSGAGSLPMPAVFTLFSGEFSCLVEQLWPACLQVDMWGAFCTQLSHDGLAPRLDCAGDLGSKSSLIGCSPIEFGGKR
jgi:hypothetical protein